MNYKNISKFLIIVLFIFFITLVIANKTGYYVTKTVRDVSLTDEQISKFEEDVRSGKKIDLEDYVVKSVDYSNGLSNDIYKISLRLEKMVDGTIKYIFNGAGKLVSD